LKTHYGLEPTDIIPNFHPAPTGKIEKNNKVKVLWVANFKKLKQPEIFINLARDLQHIKNVEFIMIGGPALNAAYQDEQEKNISALDNLSYLGELSQDDVNEVFAKSHILINTSEYEGFSNTFIQAWMREVPVLSLNVNPDNVFDNEFLGNCAHGSYEKLRKDAIEMVTNEEKRKSIGHAALEHALENYSMKNLDRLIEILDQ